MVLCGTVTGKAWEAGSSELFIFFYDTIPFVICLDSWRSSSKLGNRIGLIERGKMGTNVVAPGSGQKFSGTGHQAAPAPFFGSLFT